MNTDIRVHSEEERTYLTGVEPLSWSGGEMCEFVSALTRMLACAGEEVAYHYLMGVTGVAFRFTFGPELWNPGFYGFEGVAPNSRELVAKAFSAIGRDYFPHLRGKRADDFKQIASSIDRGVAVMAHGHLVDASDWVLIGGYEETTGSLFCSSPYSPGPTMDGFDRVADWHEKLREYIILGALHERPDPDEVFMQALRQAVALTRTPPDAPPYRGIRAYQTLADALRQATFPENPTREQDKPWFRYLCVHCYNMMLDDHKAAPPFLRTAAATLPGKNEELIKAAVCYDRGAQLRDELDTILPPTFSQEDQDKILDDTVRNDLADTILCIRDAEKSAISHISRALDEIEIEALRRRPQEAPPSETADAT